MLGIIVSEGAEVPKGFLEDLFHESIDLPLFIVVADDRWYSPLAQVTGAKHVEVYAKSKKLFPCRASNRASRTRRSGTTSESGVGGS
jgi:hypothetical protein